MSYCFSCFVQGPLSLESKSKYHIMEIVDPPPRPFLCPFPSKGMVYDYRFIKEVQCHLYTDNRMYMAFIKTTKLNFSFLLTYGQLEEIKDVLTLRHQLNLSLNSA